MDKRLLAHKYHPNHMPYNEDTHLLEVCRSNAEVISELGLIPVPHGGKEHL